MHAKHADGARIICVFSMHLPLICVKFFFLFFFVVGVGGWALNDGRRRRVLV
jgi:hypothetical protein